MLGESEEPPGTMEGGSSEALSEAKKTSEENKNQLESLKEIMLKNKQSLKQKEEEVQEYARRLSKIKSRAKLSRRNKEGTSTSKDVEQSPKIDTSAMDTVEEPVDDISQATTPKAKSSLLQRKLAENRKVFEQRSKEITETKRAVEEKVEAIRQQLEEKDLAMMELQKDQTASPAMVTSETVTPVPQSAQIQEKDNRIMELNNKISDLQAIIIDLQENLKEKDSVIDSKTKAITLMSADLSKKGKTTLDTLEDTKDEMRTMQEHFVLLESSLKQKNENLLQQLHERDNRILELDDTIKRYEDELTEKKLSEIANADLSRSTLDTLADTKSAMTSMQENFILIESSLKMKNDNLLQQLQNYEIKLAEANERIFQLESGKGIVKTPALEDLQYKLDKLEQNNRQLQDEKYELQKSIADMQNNIIASKSMQGNGVIMEKDNRIAELENLIEELKRSNDLLKEESKTELQSQLADLSTKNEEYSNRIIELEKLVHNLEVEKNDVAPQPSPEVLMQKENEKIQKLTKELEELNKHMIKIKAQHKSKVKSLQKQLENFKMVSDTNAELVRLGNQVALLEEEKASAGDWQERIADLESRVSIQTDEMQKHVDAIAILENQKLDLIQELHSIKQKVSELEEEIADSENHRVTAEMKVVDLEEQLESVHKIQAENRSEISPNESELLQKIETLQQENTELLNKLTKLEEKGTSDTGSTESFETIHEVDKSELLKKIEDLTQKNDELALKLAKLEERNSSHAGSTESFEAINDMDKSELLKKIDQLTQENNDLMIKLNRNDEKGSSDTGSTESFERIPEHNESMAKIELLTQENHDLVIKMTKLEEKLLHLENDHSEILESNDILQIRKNELDMQNESLLHANNDLSTEVTKLRLQVSNMEEENTNFEKRVEALTTENSDLAIQCTKLQERLNILEEELSNSTQRAVRHVDNKDQINVLIQEKNTLEKELTILQEKLVEQTNTLALHEIETNDTKLRMNKLLEENHQIFTKMQQLEEANRSLMDDLNKTAREKEDTQSKQEKCKETRTESQESVEQSDSTIVLESNIISSLETEINHCKELIAEQTSLIEEMKLKLSSKEEELETKTKQILEHETSEKENEMLKDELQKMSEIIEDWKFKYAQLESKMNALEVSKVSIECAFSMLQDENKHLTGEIEQKDMARNALKEELQGTITVLDSQLNKERTILSMKEDEIANLKETLETKNQDLHHKYLQLQNEMIAIDSLQDQLNSYKINIQQKDSQIASITQEVEKLSDALRLKEDEVYSLEKKNSELHEKLRESIPRLEYDKLLEELRENEILVNNMQNKIDERLKDKHDLLAQLESVSQQNQDMQYQLAQKNEEFRNLLTIKEDLQVQIADMVRSNTDAEKRILDLESSLESNTKFANELQSELNSAYKMMEQLKGKHMEDVEMHNQRLETTIEELNIKIQECESLRTELEEKEKLIGQSVTEEVKITLEGKVADLEQKLADSENKKQVLLEKMKKVVATLTKKTASFQEMENSVREKDNRIADLEEKLNVAKNEAAESLAHVESLTNEVATMKDKMSVLVEQINELEDEIEKLHGNIKQYSSELEAERLAKANILEEYESYKKVFTEKYDEQQLILEDTKENARELRVRMQVMEAEYIEQLAMIKHLQAENALLSSKQMQIDEKLETAEKESEDRRLLIEELQKRIVSTVDTTTQTSEDESRHDARTIAPQCDHCEQCQTIVQALEAKLQEREAEIENLDNELANSIGNFVQMRESLRFNDMMNQSGMRNRTMEDPYNDLLYQYNALLANNEEIKAKLEYTIKENEELAEKIKQLESLNVTMEERILATEETMMQDKQSIEKLQDVDSLHTELVRKYEERGNELKDLEEKLEAVRNETRQSVEVLEREISVLKAEKEELVEKYKSLSDQKEILEERFANVNKENDANSQKLADLRSELEESKLKNTSLGETSTIAPTGSSDFANIVTEEKYTAPPLFDASKIFGPPRYDADEKEETKKLRDLVNDKDIQCTALKQEIESLQRQLSEDKAQTLQTRNACEEELRASRERCQLMEVEIENLRSVLEEKIGQIESLNEETRNVGAQMEKFKMEYNDSISDLQHRLVEIEELEGVRRDLSSKPSDEKEFRDGTSQTDDLASTQSTVPVEEESRKLSVGDSNEKLNVDEDTWGWNADDVQSADEHNFAPISVIPTMEIQLRTKIDELEKKVEELENEKAKLTEESKAAQIRSAKMVKKLKEYKVQIENLQQQLKSQKSVAGFCELDTAIEEELRSQIAELEKNLKELKEEHKNAIAEKEALLKRIDVIVSANERYMEMKERQDMEVEVLKIQNKDLTNKLESMEARFSAQEGVSGEGASEQSRAMDQPDVAVSVESVTSAKQLRKRETEDVADVKSLCDKYKEELESVKDDMEALATENEQLQHYLEEQKNRISMLESKVAESESDRQESEKARKRNDELEELLQKSRQESEESRRYFEERFGQISEEAVKLEQETRELREKLELSEKKAEHVLDEKAEMEERVRGAKITEEKLSAVSESLTEVTELLNARVQEVADLKQELQKQYIARQDIEERLQEHVQRLTQELQEKKEELEELRAAFSAKESGESIEQKSVETVSILVSEATQELVQKHAIEIEERNKEIRNLRDKLNILESNATDYISRLATRPTEEEAAALVNELREKEKLLETVKADLATATDEMLRQRLGLEESAQRYAMDTERYLSTIGELENRLRESQSVSTSLREQAERLPRLEQEFANLQSVFSEKELLSSKLEEQLREYDTRLKEKETESGELRKELANLDEMRKDLRDSAEEIIRLTSELEAMRIALEQVKGALREKESALKEAGQKLEEKQMELDRLPSSSFKSQETSSTVDGLPLFRMGNDNEDMLLRSTIEDLNIQLEEKRQEVEHLKYVIEENTYPKIIQEMQDKINFLYDEKARLENALLAAARELSEKQNEIENQVEVIRLQNQLHAKEQEINELRYIIAEKDSQLSQVSSEPALDDYELRNSERRLQMEVYAKEEEIQQLRSTISSLRADSLLWEDIQKQSEERMEIINRLTSEKEAIRSESKTFLERKLAEKESEIDAIKQRLSMENQELLGKLRLREQDVENLKRQLETSSIEWDEAIRRKDEDLRVASANLQEQEKRFVELIYTKDSEIQNLTIQIQEKSIRIEELVALSEKHEKELTELRQFVEEKEIEIRQLEDRLDVKVREYESIQRVLKKDFPIGETRSQEAGMSEASTIPSVSPDESRDSHSNELDLALYMLHQRDLRCEELTHELMQLLEERDTLQLRLSNAIRVNEDLRKIMSSDSSPKKDAPPASSETTDEPLVEHPSPSKSDGPVEIAKEAIDSPMRDNKEALSLKLSQLHTVGHTKDVRLRDERELRHTQQMSLLAHKDVLSTLPPEAAEKLVNANYTLSRDVQSQSSVLLNWLWGKSTPKVMHM
ncbi:hypothetical protein KPH14_002157 [Odynerus spinipes]|uniref:Golgin subfamily B member 1 n=1 Tax=Odynerus spinipes TaxID=1348599 RepID=A0AAD9VP82_9HYME|nr:hypothetical protein KPH14_002157 [Odynerus spinipes]